MKNLSYRFEKINLEWFQYHQKLETHIWFGFGYEETIIQVLVLVLKIRPGSK